MNNMFLNEENYQKTKKKLSSIALVIFIIGLLIGGLLIFKGITNQREIETKYGNLKELSIREEHKKNSEISSNYKYYAFGGMIIFIGGVVSLVLYTTSRGREITAFKLQQMMPLAKEGLEDIAPSIGKAGATINKEMASSYGEVAKEISKGIKEGLNSKDNK